VNVAERTTRRVAHDRMDEPHIVGRRISVRQVYALVEERGGTPRRSLTASTSTSRASITRSRTITTTFAR